MANCLKGMTVNQKKGCIHPPLINIEPRDCVVDELHLFLRITDVLFESLFVELHRLDYQAQLHKIGTDDHINRTESIVRRVSSEFRIRFTDNETTRSKSGLEATGLNRNHRLRILANLPASFDELLPNNLALPLAKLWMVS